MKKRMIGVVMTLLLLLTGIFPANALGAEDGYCTLYVAADGDDAGSGTINSPLATLAAARDKIREKKAAGEQPEKGYVVYLRGGDYQMHESFVLSEEDSGTESAPVVYRSYPGETAVIIGGASIGAGDFQPLTDNAVKERVVETAARDKIVAVDLKELGFDNYGEVYLNGRYSYTAPLPGPAPAKSPELVIDGTVMSVAKYPNSGYMKIDTVIELGFQAAGVPGGNTTNTVDDCFVIGVKDKRIGSWKNAEDALLYGLWFYDWADGSVPVRSIDASAGTIESGRPSYYGVKQGQNFYVYNLLEEIDVPGEYYLDRKNGILYLYPPASLSSDSVIRFSLMEDHLITVNGASYVDFKGLKFTTARKSALVVNSGRNVRLMDSEVEYTAETGVQILDGAKNCGVINSYLHDVNGGVLLRGGVYDTLEPGENYAENNEIERFSRIDKTYTGAVTLGGVGNRASYNEIHDGPHLAILFYGQDNIVEYNEIYEVVKEGDDSGVIYGGQSWVGRGLQIRYNYIHDIKSESAQSVGRAAVYLDGGQCSVTMMGNIVDNVAGSAFWVNGGRNNNVFNNIIINCESGVYMTDIMATGILPLETMLNGIKNYPWVNPESEPWKSDVWTERYPEMLPMLEDEPLLPKDNMMKNNVIVNGQPTRFLGGAARFLDMDNNYVTNKDPGFYDMGRKNYLLKQDSVVYSEVEGFIPLPFTRMGRFDKRALYRVKDAFVLAVGSPFARTAGADVQIDPDNRAVVPRIIGDRTFVPLRFIAESLGAEVAYDDAVRAITITGAGITLEMTADSTAAVKNGESVTLENAPLVLEDRTLVPLREVSNLFDQEVFWDDCGLIAVSGDEALFTQNDGDVISYLHEYLTIY